MLITKADGTQEPWKASKLRSSLKRAGASAADIHEIVRRIEAELTEGMSTQKIYRKAFDLLRKSTEPTAAKYSMRRALYGLGPTGFPFESFLARLFEAEGYRTRTGDIVSGKCAEHEIDVSAFRKEDSFVCEAKFHHRPGIKTDLQIVMYAYARFLDLKALPVCREDTCGVTSVTVATNTKFTHAAERYAECVGLKLLSWGYPHGNTLQDRIEAAGVFPVTVLSTLSGKQKRVLLENGAILCKDILLKPQFLKELGLSAKKTQAVTLEARQLCNAGE